jgi:hypothetical protein
MGTDFIYRRERGRCADGALRAATDDRHLRRRRTRSALSKLKNNFYKDIDGIKTQMYDDLIARGYYQTKPGQRCARSLAVSAVAAMVGGGLAGFVVLLIFLFVDLSIAAPSAPASVSLGSLVSHAGCARYMPRKTDAGAEAAARWKAFKRISAQHRQIRRCRGAERHLGSLAALRDCLRRATRTTFANSRRQRAGAGLVHPVAFDVRPVPPLVLRPQQRPAR